MITESGRKIDRKKAEALLDNRTIIKQSFDRILGDLITNLPESDIKRYVTSKCNGYVFSKALIQRFFEAPGDSEYLLVILAAHDVNDGEFKTGDPTVVVAGIKASPTLSAQDGEVIYESMKDDYPANEHPPAKVLVDFPPPPLSEENKMFFIVR